MLPVGVIDVVWLKFETEQGEVVTLGVKRQQAQGYNTASVLSWEDYLDMTAPGVTEVKGLQSLCNLQREFDKDEARRKREEQARAEAARIARPAYA